MDEAAIRRFIDGLEDARGFELDTTAVDGWPSPQRAGTDGVEAFMHEGFGHALREFARYPDDPPFAVVAVETPQRFRVYTQGPCETVGWLLARVREEVLDVFEPWLFVLAPEAMIGWEAVWEQWADRVVDQTAFRMRWLVEARGRGAAERHHGVATLQDRTVHVEAQCDLPPPAALDRVLRGHPDRRRYPIRRYRTPGR